MARAVSGATGGSERTRQRASAREPGIPARSEGASDMDLVVPEYIVELAASARRAFGDLGAVDLARRAETDPAAREQAGDALRALGAGDIDPLADADQALAAF